MARSARVSVEVFADLRADVGEAPHWDQRRMTLLFVDLTGGTILPCSPVRELQANSFSVGQEVGAVVPRRDGRARARGPRRYRRGLRYRGQLQSSAPVERDAPDNRMNDAKCDPAGRLLAGTTGRSFTLAPHAASLYRVRQLMPFDQIVRDVTQSNGIAWSPDGRQFILHRLGHQSIDVFDYDTNTRSPASETARHYRTRARGAHGMTVDSKGTSGWRASVAARSAALPPAGEQLDEVSSQCPR